MSDRPLISMCLIVKNEKHNIRRCFNSWWDHVDEVIVIDTGSDDGTLGAAFQYAKDRKQPDKLKTDTFKWCDDFAAARQAADALATGEWVAWADLDDTITGMEQLRRYATDATDDVVAFFCRYSYARDPDENAISELWRERLVRNDGTRWVGRLHEHKLFTQGAAVKVDPAVCEWVHHRDHLQRTGERNLAILEKWDRDDPENPRVVHSLAMEYMGLERHRDASDTFARLLAMDGEPPDRRCQATRHMCVQLMLQSRVQEARAAAFRALQEDWLWADTHLTLAEVEQSLGRPDVGLVHARTALEIGKPDTLLIVNPLQYTAHPHALIAVCLGQMGQVEEAMGHVEECLRIAPSYPLAQQQLPFLRSQVRRQLTVTSFLSTVEVLVEVGELEKARVLLGQAPWYVVDDARLIRRRVELSREIDRRVREPVVLEDEQADTFVKQHLEEAA